MGNVTDDNHRSGEQGLGEQSRAKWPRLPILVAAAFSLATLLVGLSTEVWIGDESHHYWVALSYFRADGRVAIASGAEPAWAAFEAYLYTDPLWPYMLSRIWALAGNPCFALAQLYQAGWFFAFLVGFYLVVRSYCTEKAAVWSMVLAASMPMIAAFGTLFVLNVPMLAVLVWVGLTLAVAPAVWVESAAGKSAIPTTFVRKRPDHAADFEGWGAPVGGHH